MEDENRRLKLLVAELSLHGEALKRASSCGQAEIRAVRCRRSWSKWNPIRP
jgi:hypothetical protein